MLLKVREKLPFEFCRASASFWHPSNPNTGHRPGGLRAQGGTLPRPVPLRFLLRGERAPRRGVPARKSSLRPQGFVLNHRSGKSPGKEIA